MTDFTDELPYGVFSRPGQAPRVGVAIGDRVLDVGAALAHGAVDPAVFAASSLNAFLAEGPEAWAANRHDLQQLTDAEAHLVPLDRVRLHLPVEVADYVDFYASEHHATNVGRIFRPDGPPLTPNWKHLPIGYHGRAGTVVVSGTDIVRPNGQRKAPDDAAPTFGPSRRLDIEAELGWVVGVGSELGRPVPIDAFADHVFGVVILNDWSARDLQAWEYVPLGPFLGKSFATSISAWVLPLAALTGDETEPPRQEPELLPYLSGPGPAYAIDVTIELDGHRIATCPYATMYYTPAQMLAHLTVNGASLRTGDLFGSGTISGPEPDQFGSLLELTWNGTQPLDIEGTARTFLEDGDEVVMTAVTPSGVRLGEVRGTISPKSPSRRGPRPEFGA